MALASVAAAQRDDKSDLKYLNQSSLSQGTHVADREIMRSSAPAPTVTGAPLQKQDQVGPQTEKAAAPCPIDRAVPTPWYHTTWRITNDTDQCTLHLTSGSISGNLSSDSAIPWHPWRNSITAVSIDGDLTIDNSVNDNAMFSPMPSLAVFTATKGLHLVNGQGGFLNTEMLGVSLLGRIEGVDTWDTAKVTDMSNMFYNCSGLTTLDVTHFDTTNVTNMSNMFYNCSGLTTLDVTHFDTAKVTNMSNMFFSCSGLTTLDVTHFDTTNVTNMNSMFALCYGLKTLDVTHFDTAKVTDMSSMFILCSGLKTLDVTHFDTAKVTNMSSMFSICSGLTTLDVTHFDTTNVTNMSSMFGSCSGLTTLDVTHFNTAKVTNMSSMFYRCSGLKTLDVTHFDTTNVTNISSMFYSCSGLKTLDVTHFNTAKVTNISYMFAFCSGLSKLDTSSFDTANITDMSSMFGSCSGLKTLDVTHFNTTKVTNMRSMFSGCFKITALDLFSFDTTKVTDMDSMLPRNLQAFRLSHRTRIEHTAYKELRYTEKWFRASSIGSDFTVEIPAIGGVTALAGVTRGTSPEGIYRAPGFVSLEIDWGNGGLKSTVKIPTGSSYTLPSPAGHANPAGKVFSKLKLTTDAPYTGTPVPNGTIAFAGSDNNWTATLTAEWEALSQPIVTVSTVHTGPGKEPSVDIRTKAIGQTTGDRLHVWSQTSGKDIKAWDATHECAAGDDGTQKWMGIPASQISPAPGSRYELRATLSRIDPVTGNTITTAPDAEAGSISTGVLPYTTVTYSNDGAASGTAPSSSDAYTDTASLKAWFTLPLLNADNGLTRADGVLDGWTRTPGAVAPDHGMGDPDDRTIAVSAATTNTDTAGHTAVTLYPVWRTGLTPDLNTAAITPNLDATISMEGATPPAFRTTGTRPDILRVTNDGQDWNPVSYENGTWRATSRQPVSAGLHTITATVTAPDVWREGRPDATFTTTIIRKTPATSHEALPMTGGNPQHIALWLATALTTTLLLSTATTKLRNQNIKSDTRKQTRKRI
ncbi:BspA family leucine-rich repeat surface protein [Bifidobacterium commune]|nr:BspA family leucine-rich repeat surface protein [Bifidobacterium commune]